MLFKNVNYKCKQGNIHQIRIFAYICIDDLKY